LPTVREQGILRHPPSPLGFAIPDPSERTVYCIRRDLIYITASPFSFRDKLHTALTLIIIVDKFQLAQMDNLTSSLAVLETSSPEDDRKPTFLPIPGPPGLPFIGNIRDVDPETPIGTFIHFADIYGPIYGMTLGAGEKRVFISSVELMEEICDESRFRKVVVGPLKTLRSGVGSGLFTADYGEKDWMTAHRILMPAFGPLKIRDMFDGLCSARATIFLARDANTMGRYARYCVAACVKMGKTWTGE